MKQVLEHHSPLALLLAVVWVPCVSLAQIGIELTIDREKYVRFEPVKATITLRNYTGNVIDFGTEEAPKGQITLAFTDSDQLAKELVRTSLAADLTLSPGQTVAYAFLLNNQHNLQPAGKYEVYAQIGNERLRQDYRSKTLRFEVAAGLPIWSRKIGLPVADDDQVIPERDVAIEVLHENRQSEYILRIDDDQRVYVVARLGKGILGGEPECAIDGVSNIHILMRAKSRLFCYMAFDAQGRRKQWRYYSMEGSKPALERDEDTGRVRVIGGKLAVSGVDYVPGEDGTPQSDFLVGGTHTTTEPQDADEGGTEESVAEDQEALPKKHSRWNIFRFLIPGDDN